MKFGKKLETWCLERLKSRAPAVSVGFDGSGVMLVTATSTAHLPWQDVTGVFAYKKDCFSTDQIRVILSDETKQMFWEITEDDVGYRELIQALPQYLPECKTLTDWWPRVAFPAFEPQWTQLYRRQAER